MLTVTHPGKLGDLLWACPTIRSLAAEHGPVRLVVPSSTKPLWNLLHKQPYINNLEIDYEWNVLDTAPASPRIPPNFDTKFPEGGVHLGYAEWPWPTQPLPFYVAQQAYRLDANFDAPWIHAVPFEGQKVALACHWTDRWFELKYGLYTWLCEQRDCHIPLLCSPDSTRWGSVPGRTPMTFENLARYLRKVSLVLTDNSAVMVLCAAMGQPCVVMEPETDRHHPIFWPGSTRVTTDRISRWEQAENPMGRRIFPVLGMDGQPTFDARHTKDLIEKLEAEDRREAS